MTEMGLCVAARFCASRPIGYHPPRHTLGLSSLRPSIALELKRAAIREITYRHRAVNPRVFGSALRGADREDGDLDLLVDALPGATLFELMAALGKLDSANLARPIVDV